MIECGIFRIALCAREEIGTLAMMAKQCGYVAPQPPKINAA